MGGFKGDSGLRPRRVLLWLAAIMIGGAAVVVGARLVMNVADGQRSSVDPATSNPVEPAARGPGEVPNIDNLTDVSPTHHVSALYPLATFTSPTGLRCAMWSNRGGAAASCFGAIVGRDEPAQHAYVDDYSSYFDDRSPPAAQPLDGKPLASGEKVVLGAGGTLMGGDEIACGMDGSAVVCVLSRNVQNHEADDPARRRGFVISPQGSWAF